VRGFGGVVSIYLRTSSSRFSESDFAMVLDLEPFRRRVFDGPDRDLLLHVGFFIVWFTKVEEAITYLIAILGKFRDLEAFDLLTKGMDANVKLERLRRMCELRSHMGEGLRIRLRHFEDKLIPIRNKISHSAMSQSEKGPKRFFFTSAAQQPFEELGMERLFGTKPPEISADELFRRALWLNSFAGDLQALYEPATAGKILELARYKSPVPAAPRQKSPRKDEPAKPSRQERKRARKLAMKVRQGKVKPEGDGQP
jgi:hypothetical protein